MHRLISFFLAILIVFGFVKPTLAIEPRLKASSPSANPVVSLEPVFLPSPVPDLTQKTQATLGPLEELLAKQKLGPMFPFNPLKYAIRSAVANGVPINLMVLLLLLPVIATVIAGARHLIGLRGFGIFLPAALSVVFVATGPIKGIGLFLLIIFVSWFLRFFLRRLKIKFQYLPRAAFLLWAVSLSVLGVLFLAPIFKIHSFANLSIFPVLILALLAEDFTRVQLGKSFKIAFSLTSETIILALISYLFLTLPQVREFVLLNPEKVILGIAVIDFILGKYVGLRVLEVWRFRKLISP